MANRINLMGYSVDYISVEASMNAILDYIQNDHLNTIGLITRKAFIRSVEKEWWAQYMLTLDLGLIDELEVLKATGINEGLVYEAVEDNRYMDRFFWQMIKRDQKFFIFEDRKDTAELLAAYLKENYPGIKILGIQWANENASPDKLINQINEISPDVIISGLVGEKMDKFILTHQNKIFGKLWLCLGESARLQKAVGIHQSWLQKRRINADFRQITNKKMK